MENSVGVSDGLSMVSYQESLKQPHGSERVPIDEIKSIVVDSNFSHSYINDNYKSCVNLETEGHPAQIANKNLAEQLDDNKGHDIDFENNGKGKGFGLKQGNEQILPLFISEKIAMKMSKEERSKLRSAVMRDGHFSAKIVIPVFNDNGRYPASAGRRYDLRILYKPEDIEAADHVGLAVLDNSNKVSSPLEDRIVKHYSVDINPTMGDLVYFRDFRSDVCGIGGRVKGIDKF